MVGDLSTVEYNVRQKLYRIRSMEDVCYSWFPWNNDGPKTLTAHYKWSDIVCSPREFTITIKSYSASKGYDTVIARYAYSSKGWFVRDPQPGDSAATKRHIRAAKRMLVERKGVFDE